MSPDETITGWIQGLKGGDEHAAARIWERFFGRVCALAERRLAGTPDAVHDAEDVALSAMHALYRGARDERFRQLEHRSDLWDVVAMITVRKSIDARRRHLVRRDALVGEPVPLEGLPDPDTLENEVDEEYVGVLCATGEELLAGLEPKLREVALLRLEGHSNAEIAERIGRSVPTVERYLRRVRAAWSGE